MLLHYEATDSMTGTSASLSSEATHSLTGTGTSLHCEATHSLTGTGAFRPEVGKTSFQHFGHNKWEIGKHFVHIIKKRFKTGDVKSFKISFHINIQKKYLDNFW